MVIVNLHDKHPIFNLAPRDKVAVPSHFYKILIPRRASGVIDTKSFLLKHDQLSSTNNDAYLTSCITSIDEIEKLTGIDFFSTMETERQEKIEAGKAGWLKGWFNF